MTRSHLLKAVAGLFAVLLLSCDNEPVDPALVPAITPVVTCDAPAQFMASNLVGGSNVNLAWTAAAGTVAWQVQYGPEGFLPGSGTQVSATDDHITLTGLNSTTSYEFYVRTVCGGESYSGWVGPIAPGETVGK